MLFFFKSQDNKYVETNTCSSISIPDNIGLFQTAKLPAKLTCVGVTVMWTDNISVSDRSVNSSIGTVWHLDKRSNFLFSTIYVKFDDPKTGSSLKNWRFRGELKEYVPITGRTKRFPLKKGKNTVIAERKQLSLILGHAIIVHKS